MLAEKYFIKNNEVETNVIYKFIPLENNCSGSLINLDNSANSQTGMSINCNL